MAMGEKKEWEESTESLILVIEMAGVHWPAGDGAEQDEGGMKEERR